MTNPHFEEVVMATGGYLEHLSSEPYAIDVIDGENTLVVKVKVMHLYGWRKLQRTVTEHVLLPSGVRTAFRPAVPSIHEQAEMLLDKKSWPLPEVLRHRARFLRHMGLRPELAMELVKKHYYRK